ncbi:MAG TPA: hypothetical protein VEH27_05870 [Methylomirabilota bacterium]|nr:hypothetical protein [Methylomirabilota bacterium]
MKHLIEDWLYVDHCMCAGMRGFRNQKTTLAKLLATHRGKRNHMNLPDLTVEQILAWADEHHQRTGTWPSPESGAIPGTEETWYSVQVALVRARRGMRKGTIK